MGQQPSLDEVYRRLGDGDGQAAASVILKLRGETCDIDCLYCYEKRKEAPGGARITAGQVRQLAAMFQGRPVSVELHGGEPLSAGRDHVGAVLRELAAQPSVIGVSLQTNGVQLDEQWLDMFDEIYPGLQIGISLDGDPAGNSWRVGYDASPVYPRVVAALRLLASRGRQAGVITAVTPAVLGRAGEILDHLAAFSAVSAVSLVPCFDSAIRNPTAARTARLPASRRLQQASIDSAHGPAWAILPGEYADFVLAATIRWISAGYFRHLKLEPAVSVIRRLRGLDTSFCHFSDLKCDHVFTLYPDGRIGSCDELPWPQARLTALGDDAGEEVIRSAQRDSALLAEGRKLMGKCAGCSYRTSCGGGCVATRWRQHRAGDDDSYCSYRMRMIDGIAALLAAPGAPAGAWCATTRWRPRSPNSMRDVAAFTARWDAGHASLPARLAVSAHGNINAAGLPGIRQADDLHPGDPQWDEAIEPGVRPLVDAVTAGWGLITYDSCQGHAYQGTGLPPAERRVGLLPRDRAEYAATAAALCRAVSRAGPAMPRQVRPLLGRAELRCEATGRAFPVLDLALRPADGDWQGYFAALDQATAVLAAALRADGAKPGQPCACVPQHAGEAGS